MLRAYLQLLEKRLDHKATKRADALAEDMMEDISHKIDAGFVVLNKRLTSFVWYVSCLLTCNIHNGWSAVLHAKGIEIPNKRLVVVANLSSQSHSL